jgi:REP element-mobilizing transposase RayT
MRAMRYDTFGHHRRSIRLAEYDYAAKGSYFITICTAGRECLLGSMVDGAVTLSAFGEIVQEEWQRSASVRSELALDVFVVMPNHIHGIVMIETTDTNANVGAHGVRPVASLGRARGSIGSMIAGFKSAATRRINDARDTKGARVWQRNYYERIIRNEAEQERIREYIATNPQHWAEDEYHP